MWCERVTKLSNGDIISNELLSEEQLRALELVLQGKSIFFTGSAGTGKSTLLMRIIDILPQKTTFVTAATGMAAINIGGMTIHKFAGIGLGDGTNYDLAIRALASNSKRWWEMAKVLIIDEISMISARLFDGLDYVAKIVRRSSRPFGGLQVICSGDFLQLPPITKQNNTGEREDLYYSFESKAWKEVIEYNIELTTVFRQKDEEFISILNEIRHGSCSQTSLARLQATNNNSIPQLDFNNNNNIKNTFKPKLEPTRLFALNKDVDELNQQKLSSIPQPEIQFLARDIGDHEFLPYLNQSRAEINLNLKIGAQVMLLRNIDIKKGLVSGAQGIVIDFDQTYKGFPRVKFSHGLIETMEPVKWPIIVEGREVASRTQLPLKLAWAITIHKSQGQTLEYAEVDLSNAFDYGQAYVALSRVSTIEGLRLTGFKPASIKAHPRVIQYYKNFDDYFTSGNKNSNIDPGSAPKRNPDFRPVPKIEPGTADLGLKNSESIEEKEKSDLKRKKESQINWSNLVIHCSEPPTPICLDCPKLKNFLVSESTKIRFEVSILRRKHLHIVISYYNSNQASNYGVNLTHESEGTGDNRRLLVKKKYN